MCDIIYVKQVSHDTYSNSSGYQLFVILDKHFKDNSRVDVSLKNATPMSSSYLNSSIGELITLYGFDKFKSVVKFVDVTPSHAEILKSYLLSCGITIH